MFIFIKGMVVKIIHSFIKFKKEKKKKHWYVANTVEIKVVSLNKLKKKKTLFLFYSGAQESGSCMTVVSRLNTTASHGWHEL